jgi:hypothetical protein
VTGLVLLDVEKSVSSPERCKELVRSRDTWTNIVLERLDRQRSREAKFRGQAIGAYSTLFGWDVITGPLLSVLAVEVALIMIFVLLLWGIRPLNPRGDGFDYVEWPSSKRTLF